MRKSEKKIETCGRRLLVSFDLEWTKNYKIKNGNKPFCFSFVYVNADKLPSNLEELKFGYISYYVDRIGEEFELIDVADRILANFLNEKSLIVGHQLSSDISVLLNYSKDTPEEFIQLKEFWHSRKADKSMARVLDTRYDLGAMLKNKSRRLVDVCTELNLDVSQPELKGSMTKMQNEFIDFGTEIIMEKLSILNLRHSLSALILCYYYLEDNTNPTPLNVNDIMYRNLKGKYAYVKSDSFAALLT